MESVECSRPIINILRVNACTYTYIDEISSALTHKTIENEKVNPTFWHFVSSINLPRQRYAEKCTYLYITSDNKFVEF